MSTSSVTSSLLSTSDSLSQLLGESSTSSTASNASANSAIQNAVNAILNSATNTSGSGIDVQSTVDAILAIDAQPEVQLQNQITTLNSQTSALKTIQSDLTALQTSVQALSDPSGAFSDVTVSSSDNNAVSATATSGASAGQHSVMVNSLATTAAYYSRDFTSASTQLPTGSFSLQVGTNAQAVTIPVDSTDGTTTLTGMANYINQQSLGVTASVVTDNSGSRLAIVSGTSGAAGALSLTDNTSGSNGNMGFTKATDSQGNALGTDASITVDGVPVTSSSNTVTGAIAGVTLDLTDETLYPVTIEVQPDLTQVSTAINSFVSAYNQVINDLNAQFQVTSSSTSAPPLLGDSSLELVQSQLLNAVTSSLQGNNGVTNLQSIGIQLQADGTLSVASSSSADSMDLNSALANNFSAVQKLFQSTSGVAQVLNTQLTSLTSTTTGPLNLDMNGINNQITDLNSQISDFQSQLRDTQTQLLAEYTTINTTLEQLPQTLAQINSQLDALNSNKSS